MKRSKILALVLAVLLVVGTFAACGDGSNSSTASQGGASSAGTDTSKPASDASDASEPATSDTNNDAPAGDDTLNLVLTMEPTGLNTMTATYSIEFSMFKHIYDNLYMLDDNDEPQLSAADDVEISEDGTVYKFHIREGQKWSNGDPVTANDFAFAWQQVLNPDVAADYAYFIYDTLAVKNASAYFKGECEWEEVGIKVDGDYNLEVTLDHAVPYAPFLFSFGTLAPINQKFYEEVGADNYNKETEYFCTNGAFKMKEWTHNTRIVLEKNADWWRAGEVSLNTINWIYIKQPQAALNEFLSGGVDMVGLSTGELIDQAKVAGYDIQQYRDGGAFYIYFNHKNEYLQNKNLRKALALGFDKQGLCDTVMKNGNVPMTSFTCPDVTGFDGKSFSESLTAWNGGAEMTPAKGDPEAAKGYLETALTELGCTVEDLSAALSIDCGDDDFSASIAAYYQEQWRQNLGIEVTVNPMPTKNGSANRKDGNYVMSMTGWGPDYNDPMTYLDLWVSTGGNNQTGYASEEYDKLIADATVETDMEKRQELFYEAEKLIAEDLPVAHSYWRGSSYAINPDRVESGIHRSTYQDINVVFVKMK